MKSRLSMEIIVNFNAFMKLSKSRILRSRHRIVMQYQYYVRNRQMLDLKLVEMAKKYRQ